MCPLKTTHSGKNLALEITPVGGMKEVGANCFLYEVIEIDPITGHKVTVASILVDCGVHPSHDFDIDEIRDRFFFLKKKNVKAILLTHLHLDHAGAASIVANMLKVPLYTPTIGRHFLEDWRDSASAEEFEDRILPEIITFKDKETLSIGPFEIFTFELAHSIPESFGFLIKVGTKKVIHFGDFKLTGYSAETYDANIALLKKLGKKQAQLLIMETLNIKHEGITPPEEPVVNNLVEHISGNPNRKHFLFCFSTNLGRTGNLWVRLHDNDVNVVVRGSAMKRSARILSRAVNEKNLVKTFTLPNSKTTALFCTGCQGEQYSYIQRLAQGEAGYFNVSEGDHVYLSSTLIPQEDRVQFEANKRRLRQLIQALHAKGARIFVHTGQAKLLDLRDSVEETHLHVSGHECRGGIEQVIKILKPSMILPYHCVATNIALVKDLVKEIEIDTGDAPIVLETSNNETIRM
tara:strand:+ start:291 stop:1679 length:1389 start_codon:yes stop_codon:yes gene_type:complete